MKKKTKLYLLLLVTFIIINSVSCKTVPQPNPIVLPSDVERPIAVSIDENGDIFIVNENDVLVEKDFYLIVNPSIEDHHIHNFIVMKNYAVRLEDYIDIIKDQIK